MSQPVVETTADNAAESARQAGCATNAIADAIDDSIGVVRHAAKQGCDAAEEFLNDATGRLQRHLALTVVVTFAAGALVGAILGRVFRHR